MGIKKYRGLENEIGKKQFYKTWTRTLSTAKWCNNNKEAKTRRLFFPNGAIISCNFSTKPPNWIDFFGLLLDNINRTNLTINIIKAFKDKGVNI